MNKSNIQTQFHQFSNMQQSSRRYERLIRCPVSYKKKKGILTLSMEDKQLVWHSEEDETNLVITFDEIIETKKEKKEKDQTELLLVKRAGERGTVFSFTQGRNLFKHKIGLNIETNFMN
jgi:UDP-N-acetylglucosamine pyrophosphorylase